MELALTPQTLLALLSVTPSGQRVPYTASVYLTHGVERRILVTAGKPVKSFEFELVAPPECLVAVDGLEFVLCVSAHESVDPYRLLEALHRAWWKHAYGEKALEDLAAQLKDPEHPRLLMAQMCAMGVQEVEQSLRRTPKCGDRLEQVRQELGDYDGLFVVKRQSLLAVSRQCRQYERLVKNRMVTWKLVFDNHLVVQFLVERLRGKLWVDGVPCDTRVWRLLEHECLEPLDEKRPDSLQYVTQQTVPFGPGETVHWTFASNTAMQQCYVHSACGQHAGGEFSEEAMWREGQRVPKHVSLNVFDFWSTSLTLPLVRVDYARRIARLTQDTRPAKPPRKKAEEKDVKMRGESAKKPLPEPGKKRLAQTTLSFGTAKKSKSS